MPADVIALLEKQRADAVSRREGARDARRSAGQRLDLARARLDRACDKHDRTAKAVAEAQQRQHEASEAVRMANDEYNEAVAATAKDLEGSDTGDENLATALRPLIDAIKRTQWADAPADLSEIIERTLNALERAAAGAPGLRAEAEKHTAETCGDLCTDVVMDAIVVVPPGAKRHRAAKEADEKFGQAGGGAAALEVSTWPAPACAAPFYYQTGV